MTKDWRDRDVHEWNASQRAQWLTEWALKALQDHVIDEPTCIRLTTIAWYNQEDSADPAPMRGIVIDINTGGGVSKEQLAATMAASLRPQGSRWLV